MRVLTGFLLLAALPLQAQEMSESEQLVGLNYHLAVAEAPGDVRSDQRMLWLLDINERVTVAPVADAAKASEPMRAYRARAQVVAAQLQARVDAARDSDPFLLGADLGCWPKHADMSVCDTRRAKLEPFVAGNGYHGVVLMAYAWAREDAAAFLRAARLAASAESYDSLPAMGLQSLVDRYRQVAPPAMPNSDLITQTRPAEAMAMGISSAIVIPPLQNFYNPCLESQGELRDHCLAIAMKMMHSHNTIEASIGGKVVEALGTPDDVARAAARKRELQWLMDKTSPLLMATATEVVAGMDDYFATAASKGEVAAMQTLLQVHGIAVLPPSDWTRASAAPVMKR